VLLDVAYKVVDGFEIATAPIPGVRLTLSLYRTVRPVLMTLQLVPPFVVLYIPELVPAYNVDTLFGSSAIEKIVDDGNPVLARAQLVPPFVDLKTREFALLPAHA
jgi:hypothetical protein